MTNKENSLKTKAFSEESAELSKELSDEDLAQVSGGAFNPEAVSKYNLVVLTGKHSGIPGLLGTIEYRGGSKPTDIIRREGIPISESSLRAYMSMPGELTIEARTTKGGPITLGKSEIRELLS